MAENCPVCFLLAPVDEQDRRGRDVPRPYVLRAPSANGRDSVRPVGYAPGQTLEFGLATFGRALSQFPYALLGIEEMGRRGVGEARRGLFRLDEVWADNPLAGSQDAIYRRARDGTVRTPALPIDAAQVAEEAATLAAHGGDRRLRVEFLTPTRLIERDRLVKPEMFNLRALLARLLERLRALFGRYSGDGSTDEAVSARPFDAAELLSLADTVRVTERRLVWRELFRGSGRHGRMVPMGGLLGEVVLEGELGPLVPWLVWGTLVHVGKDAAMGNGLLRLEALP